MARRLPTAATRRSGQGPRQGGTRSTAAAVRAANHLHIRSSPRPPPARPDRVNVSLPSYPSPADKAGARLTFAYSASPLGGAGRLWPGVADCGPCASTAACGDQPLLLWFVSVWGADHSTGRPACCDHLPAAGTSPACLLRRASRCAVLPLTTEYRVHRPVRLRERQPHRGEEQPCLTAHRANIRATSPLTHTAIPAVTTHLGMRMAWTFRDRADLSTTRPRSVPQTTTLCGAVCRKMALLSQYGGMIRCGHEGNTAGTTVMSNGSAVSRDNGYARVWPPPFVTCWTGPHNKPNKRRT